MPDRPPRRARFSERNLLAVLVLIFVARPLAAADAPPLPDTAPLTTEGDLASQMVDGIDRFLTAQTLKAIDRRREIPSVRTDLSSREALLNSTRPLRERLATILGVRDPRAPRVEMQLLATTDRPALVGKSDAFEAYAVRWPAFGDVHGEGLLLKPIGREPVADVIAIPDADQTPETIAGLREGVPAPSQFARRLAESGCRVIVPVLLDRRPRQRLAPGRKTGPELSNREFVYRSAFELGRHVIGYEIQKVLAAVDWSARENPERSVGLIGYGEGGMIALYAAALDPRVRGLAVTGYVRRGDQIWKEPIERNLFGILDRFPDQELIKVLAGRGIVTESSTGPRVKVAGKGAAPGELADPADLSGRLTPPATDETLRTFLGHLLKDKPAVAPPGNPPQPTEAAVDPDARQARQLHELDRHTQELLAKSADVRR